jgi:hypothetical protein
MMILYLTPVVLSSLVLGAHFLRSGVLPLVAGCLLLPLLLFVARPWAARAIQVALVLGGIEWLRTLIVLIGGRQATGESWARLAVILGAVMLVTFLSAAVFQLPRLRDRYSL